MPEWSSARIDGGAAGIVDAGGAAGNDDAFAARQLGGGSFAGSDFGVDAQIAHLSGDQMAVLSAGVKNRNLRLQKSSANYCALGLLGDALHQQLLGVVQKFLGLGHGVDGLRDLGILPQSPRAGSLRS